MLVTYSALLKDLSAGKYAPIYFLEGEEAFYIDKVSDYLEDHVIDPAQRDFNLTILYGRDVEMIDVLNAARKYSMFSEKQLIIVKEAAPLFTKMTDKNEQLLKGYLDNPKEDSILVFCHKHKSIDKRKSSSKALKEKAVFFDSAKIKDNQLPEWITVMVKENGFSIESRTAQILAEYLGNDLSRIENEINKLHILLPAGSTITLDVVEEHIGISKEFNSFEFKDALLSKDFHKCMRIITYFGHNPAAAPLPMLMGTLYGEFSRLYVYHQLPSMSDGEYASKLGVSPGAIWFLKAASRNYPLHKVEQVLLLLSVYDMRSKGVNNKNADVTALLNEFVYRVIFEKV